MEKNMIAKPEDSHYSYNLYNGFKAFASIYGIQYLTYEKYL